MEVYIDGGGGGGGGGIEGLSPIKIINVGG